MTTQITIEEIKKTFLNLASLYGEVNLDGQVKTVVEDILSLEAKIQERVIELNVLFNEKQADGLSYAEKIETAENELKEAISLSGASFKDDLTGYGVRYTKPTMIYSYGKIYSAILEQIKQWATVEYMAEIDFYAWQRNLLATIENMAESFTSQKKAVFKITGYPIDFEKVLKYLGNNKPSSTEDGL